MSAPPPPTIRPEFATTAHQESVLSALARRLEGSEQSLKLAREAFDDFRARRTAQAALPVDIPEDLDVRKIMLSVTPGLDGMGHEVYAKDVKQVVEHLTKLDAELEEWQLGIRRYQPLPSEQSLSSILAQALSDYARVAPQSIGDTLNIKLPDELFLSEKQSVVMVFRADTWVAPTGVSLRWKLHHLEFPPVTGA